MPIYEYRCRTCKKNFEVLQKMTEKPLAACPACGKKMHRLISRTSFSLKGGGWYKDGYASKSAGEKTPAPAKENKATEKKTESAPAAKKES